MRYPSKKTLTGQEHERTIFESNGSFYVCLPMGYIKNNMIHTGDIMVFEEPLNSMDAELVVRRVYTPHKKEDDSHAE